MRKTEYNESPWLWKGEAIDPECIYEGTYGIIYLLENEERGVKYVGKKNILRYDRKGKELGESNWLTYFSSSSEVKSILKESEYSEWKRHILAFSYSKRNLTYLEAKYLFIHNALEDPSYLNKSILGKFYRGNLE